MATVINGTDLYVFIDDEVVAHATSHSISMKMNTRATSNKDTGKWNTKAVGRLDLTASCDALVVYADYAVMAQALLDRQVVHIAFGERTGATLEEGEYVGGTLDESKFYAEGNFIITGLDQNAADEDNASYTATFENADATFVFSTDEALRVYISKSHVTENAGSDGAVLAIPKGGTPPYTFLWDDLGGSTTQAVMSLEAGTIGVTVTDSATPTPATAEASVTLTEPPAA